MVQRNLHTEGLLRAVRQVPDWASVGGRPNAYGIEWTALATAGEFYSKPATTLNIGDTFIMWFKCTDNLVNATDYGLAGFYSATLGYDFLSLVLVGDAINGNKLDVYFDGTKNATISGTIVGTGWTCVQIDFGASSYQLYLNGSAVGSAQGTLPKVLPFAIDSYTLGLSSLGGGIDVRLNDCIIDEIAFFQNTHPSASTIYNGGVPLGYTTSTSDLLASFEVEKDIGAVNVRSIGATVYTTPSIPDPYTWSGANPNNFVRLTTDTLRSVDTNPYSEMLQRFQTYASGTAVSGQTPLGTGVNLMDNAGLLPHVIGSGYSTLGYANAFVGNEEFPFTTPKTTVSGTMASDDSTLYDAIGGNNTLTGKLGTNEKRLFIPRLVK